MPCQQYYSHTGGQLLSLFLPGQNYRKFPKYSEPKTFVVITLKVEQDGVSLE